MTKPYAVERRFTRIFFSDKVNSLLSSVENKQESFPATLLNISEGGLQCSLQKNPQIKFQHNDYLILKQLIDFPELTNLTDILIQIKWVMDNEYLDHVTIGAEFCELSRNQHETLQSFVNVCQALHQEKKAS